MGGAVRESGGSRDWRRSVAITASRVRADLAFAAVDLMVVLGAYTFALWIRLLDPLVADDVTFFTELALALPVIVAIHLIFNVVAGAYGHVWEHASMAEARQVVIANALATGTLLFLAWIVRSPFGIVVPYSVVLLGGMLATAGMGLVRFRSRLFSFRRGSPGPDILVVGLSREAAIFARRTSDLESGGRVVGFVANDDEESHSVRMLAGLPIVGTVDEIAELTERYEADEVVVVGTDPATARAVVDRCLDVDVRLRILPAAEDVMLDRQTALDVRDIDVVDILVRPPVETDLQRALRLIEGKRVLVTGAGGSIGSEIVRQLIEFNPAELWALDRDETLLHEAQLRWPAPTRLSLCDIRDANKLLRLFDGIKPEVVFHAAALKHVPMLETDQEEAILTNIVGTRNVIEAGSRAGMEHFILISTDKAVDPVSVMGSSKRVAELMTQAGWERNDGCVYTAVRFGNVLGSRGSVVPTFVEQIKRGGPVTVTDPEMTRYFMTVDEAVQLVLHAATISEGSEVFLLDMGEPVKIVDLARRMIRLGGLLPDRDIEIVYTGMRPGEKLTEVLSQGPLAATTHPKILDARPERLPASIVFGLVSDLEDAARAGDCDAISSALGQLTRGVGVAPEPQSGAFQALADA